MWNRGSKVWNVENVFIKTVFGSIFPCALATRYPGNFFDMHIKKKKKGTEKTSASNEKICA